MAKIRYGAAILLSIAGACGEPDSLGEEALRTEAAALAAGCPSTTPVVVATGLSSSLSNIKTDDAWVYVMQFGNSGALLLRFDKNGSGERQEAFSWSYSALSFPLARDYEVDATHLYVMQPGKQRDDNSFKTGSVYAFNPDDLSLQRNISAVHEQGFTDYDLSDLALAADGTLYWIQTPVIGCSDISNCTLADRASIAQLRPGDAEAHIIGQTDPGSYGLTADNSHAFWTRGGDIFRLSQAGGTPELMFRNNSGGVHRIVLDNTTVANTLFWTETNAFFEIESTNKLTGIGQSVEIFDHDLNGITSDGTNLYGAVLRDQPGEAANIVKIKQNGHGEEFLGKGLDGSIAVDEGFVYYANTAQTQVLKSCKSAM